MLHTRMQTGYSAFVSIHSTGSLLPVHTESAAYMASLRVLSLCCSRSSDALLTNADEAGLGIRMVGLECSWIACRCAETHISMLARVRWLVVWRADGSHRLHCTWISALPLIHNLDQTTPSAKEKQA